MQCIIRTFSQALFAAFTFFRFDDGFAVTVLFFLTSSGTAAHANIFDSTTKTSLFMTFEMGQGNEDVSIHHRTADFCFFHIFAANYGHFNIICTLQTITDQDRAANCHGCEAIFPCAVQVFQRIFTGTGIQCITVCQEGFTATSCYEVNHCLCIVGTQEAQVAQFAKVHFDGNEFTFEIDIAHTCTFHQTMQFLDTAFKGTAAKVCIINSGCFIFHRFFLLILLSFNMPY